MPRFDRSIQPPHGFTLIELVIVIAILVLLLGLAVPAFNVMSGANSIESAQNRIAAVLAQTRMQAIGQQSSRGVVFYRDSATDRTAMALVRVTGADEFSPANVTSPAIEIAFDSDAQFLPKGIDIAFRHQTILPSPDDYIYRLTGIPSYETLNNLRGLILFDSEGHFLYQRYSIGHDTELARRLNLTNLASPNFIIGPAQGGNLLSQPAFLLFSRQATDAITTDAALNNYLNQNATVFVVNRYNASLLRSQ